jgi:hypothetical protein
LLAPARFIDPIGNQQSTIRIRQSMAMAAAGRSIAQLSQSPWSGLRGGGFAIA